MNEPIISPCISVCEVDAHGVCTGCLRTLDEIAAWGRLPHAERVRIIVEELPKREAGDAV